MITVLLQDQQIFSKQKRAKVPYNNKITESVLTKKLFILMSCKNKTAERLVEILPADRHNELYSLEIIYWIWWADVCDQDVCDPDVCDPDVCDLDVCDHLFVTKTFVTRTFVTILKTDVCDQELKF